MTVRSQGLYGQKKTPTTVQREKCTTFKPYPNIPDTGTVPHSGGADKSAHSLTRHNKRRPMSSGQSLTVKVYLLVDACYESVFVGLTSKRAKKVILANDIASPPEDPQYPRVRKQCSAQFSRVTVGIKLFAAKSTLPFPSFYASHSSPSQSAPSQRSKNWER